LLGLVLRYRRREPIRFEALALLVFFAIATRYARFTWELSILSAASLLRSSPRHIGRDSPARRVLGLVMALALLVLASTTAAQPVGLGLNANRIPVAAATFLQRHQPPGPMLNSYNFGGYLIWEKYHRRGSTGRAAAVLNLEVLDRRIVAALPQQRTA
jgi:hypothetical protein